MSPEQTTNDYLLLRMAIQDALKPLLDRMDKLEDKLDGLDERYYRKDYLDQRFSPLEQASLTKNQRLGMIVSAAAGAVSVVINLVSHVQFK
jgi:hypothetical protein